MQECNSNIIKKSIEKQDKIFGIRIKKLKGILGFEPYSDIRLGKEIGQLVRFFGIGGVFIRTNYQIMELKMQTSNELLKN